MKTKEVKSLAKPLPHQFHYLNIGDVFWNEEMGICMKCSVTSTNDHIAINLHDGQQRALPRSNSPLFPLKTILQHEPTPI